MATLESVRVIVVGAGLSGLTAANDLSRRGAWVEVIEARERIGGRVWTVHDDVSPVYAESGGEFIDAGQREIRALCRTLGVGLVPVLRGGFGLALDLGGRVRIRRSIGPAWRAFAQRLRPALAAYRQGREDDDFVAAGVIAATLLLRSTGGCRRECATSGARSSRRRSGRRRMDAVAGIRRHG